MTPEIFHNVLAVELNTPVSINADITPNNDLNLNSHLTSAEHVFSISNTLSEILLHSSDYHLAQTDREMVSLDNKLDICIRLLTLLFEERDRPESQKIKISSRGIEWSTKQKLANAQQLYIEFYPSMQFPRTVILPVEVVSVQSCADAELIQARFIGLPIGVQDGLEKFIFREHRHQVSRLKHS